MTRFAWRRINTVDAPGRSRARHEAWLASRLCCVLRFDEDQAIDARVEQIVELI
ncbi:hypothetical protein [Paraburkholderia sp. J12]|uniref:hypothetical protein n=1 Tax=Paraburkholderia sp. J12 TaxID=2805432 RepID=UPI002ABD22CD|nr:hypothetical protein [Paraburkholderia sp. J12]